MPAASAAPTAAAAPADEPAAVRYFALLLFIFSCSYAQEAPKEKTVFNVKLESFDAGSKPKVIREVKAMNPTLTLIDVGVSHFVVSSWYSSQISFTTGKEVRRIVTSGLERKSTKRRSREDAKNLWSPRSSRQIRLNA